MKKIMQIPSALKVMAGAIALSTAGVSYAADPVSVSASSDDGNTPDNTLDNSLSSRWSAQGDGQWIEYDLGQVYSVDTLEIALYKGDQRTSTLDIQTSADGNNWQTVFSGEQPSSTSSQQTFDVTDSDARYVRIVGYGNSSNDWNSITEVDIETSTASSSSSSSSSSSAGCGSCGTNVTASASTDDGNVAENVLDGDLNTRWSGNGDGAILELDLGTSQTVGSVDIAFFKGDERNSMFEIQTSANGSNWDTVLYSAVSSGNTTSLENFAVEESEARYVRYVGNGNTANSWNSVTEMSVSSEGGTDGGGDNGGGDNGGGDNGGGDNGGGDNGGGNNGSASIPSDLMSNCNQWKITYPDGVEDKTLCGEDNNEYFYVNTEGNGLVFFAPVRSGNGTTPNSSYIRSELREREADGSKDIYWTTSGQHTVYVKQAITHLPIVKSHLVATQIHGNKDDGIDDALVLRLEDNHLFLSFNGGKLRSDVTVSNDYSLGTEHEVIFDVVDGKHYVFYSEDGNLDSAYASGNASQYLVRDGSNDYVMDRSYGEAYFKIGNYTQSNADKEGSETGDPDNYGEVVVYDYWVDHQ
ncbi:discoidin domain-containing protein [Gilvimarinus agarilyticus]|uniref:discoidin domain-containing protein n=1 Tax=Gilvimarinus sp. 2_MG-2023 TaxID=3062666 RepID=UPI001C0A36B7|nr:discoidin domain-containing protein [Gilvimarinus sp. 2_MG-2023]MBU2886204.1 discoidin domain-containing protein [Gilvimarinus agarilyticus]MDO6570892.1 discoidin domain-containing protein [Gilvimarinus sp. 2_MG-2023]